MAALKRSLAVAETPASPDEVAAADSGSAPRLAVEGAPGTTSPARLLQGDLADRLAIPTRRSTRRLIALAGTGVAATGYCAWAWFSLIRWLMDVRPGG